MKTKKEKKTLKNIKKEKLIFVEEIETMNQTRIKLEIVGKI